MIVLGYANIMAFDPVDAILIPVDRAAIYVYPEAVNPSYERGVPPDTIFISLELNIEKKYELKITDAFAHRYKIEYRYKSPSSGSVIKTGWIDKSYVGLYLDRDDTKLYYSPSAESGYIDIPSDNRYPTVLLLEIGHGGFMKVLFETYDGKYYEGWIDRYKPHSIQVKSGIHQFRNKNKE